MNKPFDFCDALDHDLNPGSA